MSYNRPQTSGPTRRRLYTFLWCLLFLAVPASPGWSLDSDAGGPSDTSRRRIRALGLTIGQLTPGPLNAITDVAGVKVGHDTLHRGEGALQPGQGPVRTGVTVVIPRADVWHRKVPAGAFVLNGTGEMTGLA